MAINLSKGERINLTKQSSGAVFRFALGWNANAAPGQPEFDLDASAFLCHYDAAGNPKLIAEPGFVYYNNKVSADGGVVHSGDNRTGAGDGDDEVILVDTSKLDPLVEEISFVVTIHEGAQRGQNFGQVKKAYVRILEGASGEAELARYDLEEDFSGATAMHFGSLYKKDGEWRFKAMGAGLGKVGLAEILTQYGAQAA